VLFFRLVMLLSSILLIGSGVIYLNSSKAALYSYIIAYITTSIILLSSFKSYQRVVKKRLDNYIVDEFDERDFIDKIDDPFSLYDEVDNENLNIKEIIKKEKELLKKSKRSFKNSFKDSILAFNPIRLIAYALFVGGFFYLLKSNNLSLIFYLATIILPNIIIVLYLLNFNKVK